MHAVASLIAARDRAQGTRSAVRVAVVLVAVGLAACGGGGGGAGGGAAAVVHDRTTGATYRWLAP